MILAGYTVDVLSYAPSYEAGIAWKTVGNTLHASDDGPMADHYSTSLVLSADAGTIRALYGTLIGCTAEEVGLSDCPPIWGPMVDGASITRARLASVAPPVHQAKDVCTLEVKLWGSFSGSLIPERLGLDLDRLLVSNITRDLHQGQVLSACEIGSQGANLRTHTRTAQLTLTGTRADLGPMLAQLIGATRTAQLTINTKGDLWLFTSYSSSATCCCIAIAGLGPLDKASYRWEVSLTLAQV